MDRNVIIIVLLLYFQISYGVKSLCNSWSKVAKACSVSRSDVDMACTPRKGQHDCSGIDCGGYVKYYIDNLPNLPPIHEEADFCVGFEHLTCNKINLYFDVPKQNVRVNKIFRVNSNSTYYNVPGLEFQIHNMKIQYFLDVDLRNAGSNTIILNVQGRFRVTIGTKTIWPRQFDKILFSGVEVPRIYRCNNATYSVKSRPKCLPFSKLPSTSKIVITSPATKTWNEKCDRGSLRNGCDGESEICLNGKCQCLPGYTYSSLLKRCSNDRLTTTTITMSTRSPGLSKNTLIAIICVMSVVIILIGVGILLLVKRRRSRVTSSRYQLVLSEDDNEDQSDNSVI